MLTRELYLDLMKECLTGSLFADARGASSIVGSRSLASSAYALVNRVLGACDLELCRPYRKDRRAEGKDWPAAGETMMGRQRLSNLQECIENVIREGVLGDLIETGVWRGGGCIFMRAVLKAWEIDDRTVWVADSFRGLPRADGRYPEDAGDEHWKQAHVLSISLEEVRANFVRYGLLDAQVRFVEGWFKDSLPPAGIGPLAILRLDGDMYSSTMDALGCLYEKLSPGGYAIVDDFGAIPACRKAVEDFRARYGIRDPIREIDWTGVYWQKS